MVGVTSPLVRTVTPADISRHSFVTKHRWVHHRANPVRWNSPALVSAALASTACASRAPRALLSARAAAISGRKPFSEPALHGMADWVGHGRVQPRARLRFNDF